MQRPCGWTCFQTYTSASQPMYQSHLALVGSRRGAPKDPIRGPPITREGRIQMKKNSLRAKARTSIPKHWIQFSASTVQDICTTDTEVLQDGAMKRLALDKIVTLPLISHVISNMSVNLSESYFSHLLNRYNAMSPSIEPI